MSDHPPHPESPTQKIESLFSTRLVETTPERKFGWTFIVDENYSVFISAQKHEIVCQHHGIDRHRAITEGYILFDRVGAVKTIRFNVEPCKPGTGSPFQKNDAELYKCAIESKMKLPGLTAGVSL